MSAVNKGGGGGGAKSFFSFN